MPKYLMPFEDSGSCTLLCQNRAAANTRNEEAMAFTGVWPGIGVSLRYAVNASTRPFFCSRVEDSVSIFRWRRMRPSSSASGRGGQPEI